MRSTSRKKSLAVSGISEPGKPTMHFSKPRFLNRIAALLCFVFIVPASNTLLAQIPNNSELGLIAYLCYVKSTSENYIKLNMETVKNAEAEYAAAIKNPRDSVTKLNALNAAKDSLVKATSQYVKTKVAFDQILLQLTADLGMRSSIARYKVLNRRMTKDESVKNLRIVWFSCGWRKRYIKKLQEADESFRNTIAKRYEEIRFINIAPQFFGLSNDGVALTFDTIELLWSINKGIKEMRGKQVEAISSSINNLRLAALSEFESKPKEGK